MLYVCIQGSRSVCYNSITPCCILNYPRDIASDPRGPCLVSFAALDCCQSFARYILPRWLNCRVKKKMRVRARAHSPRTANLLFHRPYPRSTGDLRRRPGGCYELRWAPSCISSCADSLIIDTLHYAHVRYIRSAIKDSKRGKKIPVLLMCVYTVG